jgi:putative ABC transport system ATP-binding protein
MVMQNQDVSFMKISNVSKTYSRGREKISALDDVSLTIKKGELLAIVGPSGSGKTTLVSIIGGLTTPDRGSISLEGKVIKKNSDRRLSEYRNVEVGFVFQNFSLIPYYSALENVIIPLIVAKVSRRKRRERAKQYLKLLGLESRVHQRADELSGGERQRVSIARALINHPQIIIADEPTGSLDSAKGNEIMNILEMLSHKQHVTVLMVTHDESLASRADRIVRIHDGRIVEEKTHANR